MYAMVSSDSLFWHTVIKSFRPMNIVCSGKSSCLKTCSSVKASLYACSRVSSHTLRHSLIVFVTTSVRSRL